MTFEEYVLSQVLVRDVENFDIIIKAVVQQDVATGVYLKDLYNKREVSRMLETVFGKAKGSGPRNFQFKRQFDSEIQGNSEEKTTKKCNKCNVTYPLNNFYSNGFDNKGKRKYKPSCKTCENSKRRNRLNTMLLEHFGSISCKICGYDKCREAIEFHHIDPSKKEWRIAALTSHKPETIQSELAKGILVCANCHREIHYGFYPEYLIK